MDCEPLLLFLKAPAGSRKDQHRTINDVGLTAQGRVFLLSLEPDKTQIGARSLS